MNNRVDKTDIYIEFKICDVEYWGVIKNFLDKNSEVKTNAFSDAQNINLSREWIIRTKGLIKKAIINWLKPENGVYIPLKEIIVLDSETGAQKTLNKGTIVEVINCYDDRILIKVDQKYYYLSGKNWIYFNYWFEKTNR